MERARLSRALFKLAERTGLAYVPQAADFPAGKSLRALIRVPRRGNTLIEKKKGPTNRALSIILAERTGLEPATPGVTGRYSNQLNYHSVFTLIGIADHDAGL
jgi:hypothetical protein